MEVAEPRERQAPNLPMDLLLEIVARCDDVTTVVRCAAGSKPVRRAMLGPGFLNILRRRADANGGFDPSLLMAVSYRVPPASSTGTDTVVVQPPGRLRLDTDLIPVRSSIPASSRDGLLVVRRDGILLVCNTITGHVTSLPSTSMPNSPLSKMYHPALLSVDGAGSSFELLVMYECDFSSGLGSQIISSQEDKWGATREIHIHNLPGGYLTLRSLTEASSSAPAVVGRSVHWLCYISRELIILALHVESAQASLIKLPQELVTRMRSLESQIGRYEGRHEEKRILTTTAPMEGEKQLTLGLVWRTEHRLRLLLPGHCSVTVARSHSSLSYLALSLTRSKPQEPGNRASPAPAPGVLQCRNSEGAGAPGALPKRLLVVAEPLVISTWTLVRDAEESSSISWSRQVVIRRREIDRPRTDVLGAYQPIMLRAFGERSGNVLFWMQDVGLVQLNLGTKKALVLWRGYKNPRDTTRDFLHEINLISVLESSGYDDEPVKVLLGVLLNQKSH